MLKKLLLPVMAGCLLILPASALLGQSYREDNFRVKYYNIRFELNPANKVFRSHQEVTFTNASDQNLSYLAFILNSFLIIDDIKLVDAQGNRLEVKNKKESPVTFSQKDDSKKFIFETAKEIKAGADVILNLKYHLDPQYVYEEVPENIWSLVISPRTSYAIGPVTGHNPICGRLSAPFAVTIKYPDNWLSCVPGDLVSFKKEKGFRIDTYRCRIKNIPTFSCAPYKKMERKKKGLSVEFYTYPGQSIEEELVENTFKIVDLFFKYFGDNGTKSYKFAAVGRLNHPRGGGESKGNTIYYSDKTMRDYTERKAGITTFIAHEVFHNWNLWSLYWEGKLGEWFGEGGANFFAAWAMEKLLGIEDASKVRKGILQGFITDEGHKSGENLENVRKTGAPERALIYRYGALVWEQLRQKIGDEKFLAAMGEFFRTYSFKNVNADKFFSIIKAKSGIDMEQYMAPWFKHNAVVDLLIPDVHTRKEGEEFTTRVVIEVKADRDYPILTRLGYRLPGEKDLQLVDVSLPRKGKHQLTIKSKEKPTAIQIDPFYRVPQVNLDNNTWQPHGMDSGGPIKAFGHREGSKKLFEKRCNVWKKYY
jgi:aminopeptidase N